MKKKILLSLALSLLLVCFFVISISASAPSKPELDVSFGSVTTIEGFVAPSELYVNTDERVLLADENGNYVTYPTYYVTGDSATFDMDFSKLNAAQAIQYTKKSVVMIEIPNGVTTVSQSYFAGTSDFPLCVSVQFPGTVTTYGSNMFHTNTVIKVVEFLDGTEPITMGDQMFGCNWSVGTTKLEYVKFPNNLVSIGNSTFGKSHASKTIILGENLETIGTGFFGESTPNGKDTFIYASDKFFADSTKMFNNLFGGVDKHHNSYMRITIFYVGTQEKAQAFVDAGLALQPGYIYKNLKMTDASEYDYATHKPTAEGALTMVYNYNACDAFYNGTHNDGTSAAFEGEKFLSEYVVESGCTRCGDTVEVDRLAPLFVNKGYSYSGTAILQEFAVNRALIEKYEAYFGDIRFGLVATGLQNDGAIVNKDGTGINEKVAIVEYTEKNFDIFTMKVNGVGTDEYADKQICVCAYLIVNGEVSYIDNGQAKSSAGSVSYNGLQTSQA